MRCSPKREMEGMSWKGLRDMYGPCNTICRKNVAQKLHDKDSFGEDDLFVKMVKVEASTSAARSAAKRQVKKMKHDTATQ